MPDKFLEALRPIEVSDLGTLAKQINAAHDEVSSLLESAVYRAAEAGHLLARAKEQVPHGQWEAWVAENTAIAPRTARAYMQTSRFWQAATKAKRRALADLGLQGLLVRIAEPQEVVPLRVIERVSDIYEPPPRIRIKERIEALPAPKAFSCPSEDPDPATDDEALEDINREWDLLDTANRDKFLSEKLETHGHPIRAAPTRP